MSRAVARLRLQRQVGNGFPQAVFHFPRLLRRLLCLALVCSFAAVPGPAAARRSERAPWFQVYNWNGELAFDIRNRYDLRETNRQSPTETSEWTLGEEIWLGADAWVYHPAFMLVSSDLGLVFQQNVLQTKNATDDNVVDLLQVTFDVNVELLPEKPYPITLFAGQAHSEINPPFTERRIIDTLRYGAGIYFRDLAIGEWEIPTRVYYRHFGTDVKGRFPNTRARDRLEFIMDNETRRSLSRLDFDWELQQSESAGSKTSQERQTLQGFNEFRMDNGGRLSSQFLFRNDDTSNVNIITATLNESLNLVHDHRLRSTYTYTFRFQEASTGQQMVHAGGLGVSHQLYESLSSSANAGASFSTSTRGDTLRLHGGTGLRYTKTIPGGSFGLRFSPLYSYQDENLEPGTLHQTEEEHSVTFIEPIFELDNLCVLESTIEIQEADTRLPLTPEQFTILPRGSECSPTRIRIETDAINDGIRDILVSYDYEVQASRSFATLTLNSGFNLALWEHLSLDLSYSITDQTLFSGEDDNTTLSDSQSFLGFLDLSFDHNRTRLEAEIRRSDISPENRVSASHSYSFEPMRRARMGLAAKLGYNEYTDTGRTTLGASIHANGTVWLPYRIMMRTNFFARYLDQDAQNTFAVGGSLSLGYRFGLLHFELQDRLFWSLTKTKTGSGQTVNELRNSFHFRVSRPF